MATTGDNSDYLLKSFTSRLCDLMGQIADLKGEMREELKAAKGQGLDIKALLKVAKELTLEPEQRERQLAFEFEVDAYRKAVGLMTEIGESSDKEAA